jgi:hypothetical protein
LRTFLRCWSRRCLALVRGRVDERALRGALLLLAAMAGGGLAVAGDSAKIEAQEYAAYSDPEKAAISFIFSDDQNVGEFREEFALSDPEMEEVLAAVRAENEALVRAYDESEIAASDYNEKVRAAIAETKATIEALLPEDRRADLQAWVDAQWQQEVQEFQTAKEGDYQVSARGLRCGIYASWYRGYSRYEVALPHRRLKFDGGYRVRISHKGHSANAPVKEVGPWNTRDDYWESGKRRDMWRNLPRCKPEAEAAFFNNYNRGREEDGHIVTNPAGVDLTLAVARRMGIERKLKQKGVIRVNVSYPWVRR